MPTKLHLEISDESHSKLKEILRKEKIKDKYKQFKPSLQSIARAMLEKHINECDIESKKEPETDKETE